MAFYEVEVKAQATEYYLVEADTEEQAIANWADGELLSSEVWDADPIRAVLDFDFDDGDIPDDDPYEIDPLHVVEYD